MCHWLRFDLLEEAINVSEVSSADECAVDTTSVDLARSSSAEVNAFDEGKSELHDDEEESEYESMESDASGDDIAGIFPLAELPKPQKLRAWAEYAAGNTLDRDDTLLIGVGGSETSLQRRECKCSADKFRHQLMSHQMPETIHHLGTRSFNVYKDSKSLGVSLGYKIASIKSDRAFKTDFRYYKDVLVEQWKHDVEFRNPRLLQSRFGVLVSLCTRNAIKCTILDLLWTPSIQRLLKLYKNSPTGQHIDYWDLLWRSGPNGFLEMWDNYPERQEKLGCIVALCLKQLQHTGYDRQRSEYNALWVQESQEDLERIALKTKNHTWVQTIRDSTVSCSMAVLVEDSFCIRDAEDVAQKCRSRNKHNFASRLETTIQVVDLLPPFDRCKHRKKRGKISPEVYNMPNGALRESSSQFIDVSSLAPGERIWITAPQHRLSVISVLSESHLLLEWDASLTDTMKNAIIPGPPSERRGHQEFLNDRGLNDDVELVLVHIQSSSWGTKEKIASRNLRD